MNSNFELVQDAEISKEITSLPALGAALPLRAREAYRRKRKVRLTLDELAQEELHKLVQRLFLLQSEPPRTVVFAAVRHGGGCTEICGRTAEILSANIPGSVCLVDADLRSPSYSNALDAGFESGLTDALMSEEPIRNFARRLSPGNLSLVSRGSDGVAPAGLLNSERMKLRLLELRKEYDYVLIDAPPAGIYSDATALGQIADDVVLILEANSTRKGAVTRVVDNLRAARINVLGAVLNKRRFPIPGVLYDRL
jgi:Mrp family chromosome partitioning ATPase